MFTLFHDLLDLMGKGLSFFYDLIPSYGLAIILLTVAVRLVMLPLTIKQTRSMQEMQKLQPEVKRLQAKYKGGDRQKMNEEMMKLYKEHKVNPLGGCLPLLLQLPIFLALYRVFAGCGAHLLPKGKACPTAMVGTKYLPGGSALTKAINAGKAGFLGMNLGLAPMAALRAAGSFPGSIVHVLPYFLLILLMVFTTWYQQKQIQAVSTGQQAQQMQMMGKIMPLLLGVFSLNLPAGVSIYWVASNIWTIAQQRFILGKTAMATSPAGGAGPAAASDAGTRPARPAKGSDAPAKSGGLMALLRQQKADAAAAATKDKPVADKPVARAKPTANKSAAKPAGNKPAAKPKPPAAGSKPPANRPKAPARAPKPAADEDEVKATADGKADGTAAQGNGTPKETTTPATPAKTNGKTPSAGGGKPVGAGSSARPRNTSAKKRRRR
ncbi:MAG: 60Kd inner rane protein [Actinobacteria bacterium]|nr:60Kd inner rane protein [Actinomycetota bacterium]